MCKLFLISDRDFPYDEWVSGMRTWADGSTILSSVVAGRCYGLNTQPAYSDVEDGRLCVISLTCFCDEAMDFAEESRGGQTFGIRAVLRLQAFSPVPIQTLHDRPDLQMNDAYRYEQEALREHHGVHVVKHPEGFRAYYYFKIKPGTLPSVFELIAKLWPEAILISDVGIENGDGLLGDQFVDEGESLVKFCLEVAEPSHESGKENVRLLQQHEAVEGAVVFIATGEEMVPADREQLKPDYY